MLGIIHLTFENNEINWMKKKEHVSQRIYTNPYYGALFTYNSDENG